MQIRFEILLMAIQLLTTTTTKIQFKLNKSTAIKSYLLYSYENIQLRMN